MQIVRTFRVAIVATGEYTEFHGGTVEGASNAIQTVLARVNEIYQQELGITLQLVPNNSSLIFTDKFSDPFSENAATMTTLQECQSTLDQLVGTDNYDLGIVFNTGQYGLAYRGSVCDSSLKGSACMGLAEPVGERFAMLVAHEIGHQFGANHSFNCETGFASGRRSPATAVEPGSGSTLMSYAGLCDSDSLQDNMDGYFHAINLEEIYTFLNSPSGNCASFSLKSNLLPNISADADVTVPILTPFALTATASDPDGDQLLYSWEEMDTGPSQTLSEADNGSSPLFRSFPPAVSPTRVFPKLEDIVSNHQTPGEQLPSTNRQLNFRLVVRDGAGTGAFAWADRRINVTNLAGSFRVTSQAAPALLRGVQQVSWDVAATTESPINVSAVNIWLSTNGGFNFNLLLASNTPNDGVESILLPSIVCTNARLKVEAVGNIFFAVNTTAFSIGTIGQNNNAPVLDPSKSPSLNSINEDAPAPSGSVGTRVSNLIDFIVPAGQNDNVSDPDAGALLGVAITAVNDAYGAWFYSLSKGSSWIRIDSVSDTNSLLLAADSNNRVFFQPNADFNGFVSNAITFRAWDRTSGSDGGFVSTVSNGGTNAFSAAKETAVIYVNPINDAPVLDTNKNPVLNAVNQNAPLPAGAVGTSISNLVDFVNPPGQLDNVTDVDSDALLGIALTAVDNSNGTWFYSLNGGVTWTPLGSVSGNKSLLLSADHKNRLYFRPNTNFSGVISNAITFRAWDQTSGSDGTQASTSFNGGTTAFSSATDTASITIKAVNTSFGRISIEPTGGYRITFKGSPGQQYTIQFSPAIPPTDWQPLGTRTADSLGNFFLIDTPPASAGLRLYRSITP